MPTRRLTPSPPTSPATAREQRYPFDFTTRDLRTIGARIEARREAIGVSILDLCAAARIAKPDYRPAIDALQGRCFTEDQLNRIRDFLHAPGRWPLERADDEARVAELRHALKLAAPAPTQDDAVPSCPHTGSETWCRACLDLAVAQAEVRAFSRALEAAKTLERRALEADAVSSSAATHERLMGIRQCRSTMESLHSAAGERLAARKEPV